MAVSRTPEKMDLAALYKSMTPEKVIEKKKSEGLESRDTMMKLFLAQLKHQGLDNVQDVTKMTTQLAQMSQVQQANVTNDKLDNIIDLLKSSKQFEAAALLDKKIIAPGDKIKFENCQVDNVDNKTNLTFDKIKGKIELPKLPLGMDKLPQKYTEVKLRVTTLDDREITTLKFGPQESAAKVPFEFTNLEGVLLEHLNDEQLNAVLSGDIKIQATGLSGGKTHEGKTYVGTKISSVLIDGKNYKVSGSNNSETVNITDLNEIYE